VYAESWKIWKIHDEKGVSIWGNNPFEEIDKLFNENLKK
jgi:pyruvate formate-lyase activating enzyme-like uncharacterized protein